MYIIYVYTIYATHNLKGSHFLYMPSKHLYLNRINNNITYIVLLVRYSVLVYYTCKYVIIFIKEFMCGRVWGKCYN